MLLHHSAHFNTLTLLLGFVFCVQTNTYAQIDHWETVVIETDVWSYLVPDAPVDSDWNTLSYDAGGNRDWLFAC